MRKLRIGILDLVARAPSTSLWSRVMNPNFASVMPQAIAVWCEQDGHDVHYVCYTGSETLSSVLPKDIDVLFVGAFTEAAQLSYAISALFRARGAITVLGGPHARCYPEDAARFFDYVLGFTDQETIRDVIRDRAENRPVGVQMSAPRQPRQLPGAQARWKFIAPTLEKAKMFKLVPMIASLGCPYTCSFCIDSTVDYQAMSYDQLASDLRFLRTVMDKPYVGWQDPNFGVRFDEMLGVIEEAVPPGSVHFVAESSLSLLSEPRLQRLRKNGFLAMLPGVESWFSLGNKSRTGSAAGMDKVRQVAEHVNMILRYIPYVQTNFVFGLDCDEGPEPFELTKRFVDLVPGAFPAYSLLTAFGRAAPLNLEFQRDGRVLSFPHHFLDNHGAMNVRPKNYSWSRFYEHMIDLTRHSFSAHTVARRFFANRMFIPRTLNVIRAITGEGRQRLVYYRTLRQHLEKDVPLRAFFDGETATVPRFYVDKIREDLRGYWDALPEDALYHDQNAYLRSSSMAQDVKIAARTTAPSMSLESVMVQ
ncbi:MAG TPA: hypothetical protein VK617_12670 [Gemmatimonadaceae bacterium]|nr:hypothetical protein [Gemmatimonadaceae bacterium]